MTNPGDRTDNLDAAQAKELGIWTAHNRMPNGEYRFRLRCADGTAYIRTVATERSGWQKSHFHRGVRETYILQKGRLALAEWVENRLQIRVFSQDEIVTTQPNVPHNVYMFPNAITHTVKHGEDGSIEDWIAYPELDVLTIHLAESEILRLAK